MIVRIKLVPNAEPNADGEWKTINVTLPFPSSNSSWIAAANHLAPYVPEGYHVVQHDMIYETPAEVARFYKARND